MLSCLGVGEEARAVVVKGGGGVPYALFRGTASVQSVDGVVDRGACRGKFYF